MTCEADLTTTTLMQGDCVHLMRKLPDQFVDLIITDPPYGIHYESSRYQNYDGRTGRSIKKTGPVRFKKIQHDQEGAPALEWLQEAYRVLRDNAAIYVFGHWRTWCLLCSAATLAGFKCKNMIILAKKGRLGMGDLRGQFTPTHELLLFAVKGRHFLNFPNGRIQDVWNITRMPIGPTRIHPNQKPSSWIEPCIIHSSKEGDLILDPFAGSGSTAIAARELNRRCMLMEIDKEWYDVAAKRLGLDMQRTQDHYKNLSEELSRMSSI